ncbi:hypothetical protein SKAU_G00387260 [Synaphobranchus kaupii]|uniref:Reverse transcriptase domain-containing protein n=1 Tax=Synaphobranchus kaupii TaxID=118154 RepID=A0A9Q1ID80_SYNKA|nr:hypothetical protein SKAU_G00387260 [Synaphobranchus kaupii]
MGLGPSFIRWVKILYFEGGSRVNINGHISGLVRQRSGVRQGCPLSPLLYVLYMEPFAAVVRADPLVDGLLVPGSGGRMVKIAQDADDTALFLQSDRALLRALTLLDQFGEASGVSLNRGKSTVAFFGGWKGRQEVLGGLMPSRGPMKILGVSFVADGAAQLNWRERLGKVQQALGRWKGRNLSFVADEAFGAVVDEQDAESRTSAMALSPCGAVDQEGANGRGG